MMKAFSGLLGLLSPVLVLASSAVAAVPKGPRALFRPSGYVVELPPIRRDTSSLVEKVLSVDGGTAPGPESV